ncbi:hypothetical protein [Bradyrhizobium sp. SZCCHNRI2007]|uniref:hypothetical protein n=1 Tax=Bradyrhizobium sp. SZCCHNRI2007 TaxID=3057281 RepID=UPI0028E483B1|nr:hypothetical protein [Bradyrhizobium sp. SZCCHNRI2007]
MSMKPTFAEYSKWHMENLNEDLDSESIKKKYSANLTLAQASINNHPFMEECSRLLATLAEEKLFALTEGSKAPNFSFSTKPYQSSVDKTFRKNCNWNRSFPKPPREGWLTAKSWFKVLDDLIRTNLVCRYIDGPERVCRSIAEGANKHGIAADFSPRATDQGYYAYHCYLRFPADLVAHDNNEVEAGYVNVEIQVTTQLQEILRELTHPFYQSRRLQEQRPAIVDRWDFGSKQFTASYLGHTLHLIEGMIVQLRDTTSSRPGTTSGNEAQE